MFQVTQLKKFISDEDIVNISRPLDKCYVIVYTPKGSSKMYMYEKQANSVREIAEQFSRIYKKENGLEDNL